MRARDAARSARAWTLAIAVATSSVNFPTRSSVSGGNGSGSKELTAIAPQGCALTMTGQEIVEVIRSSRTMAAIGPDAVDWSSILAGRPVLRTSAAVLSPSIGRRRTLLEVAQPRLPCFKLGLRMGDPRFPEALRRCRKTRRIPAGDPRGRHRRRRPDRRRRPSGARSDERDRLARDPARAAAAGHRGAGARGTGWLACLDARAR